MSFQKDHRELKELESHYGMVGDEKNFIAEALVDCEADLVMYVEAATKFHGWDKQAAMVKIGEIIIDNFTAYQEARLSELKEYHEGLLKDGEPTRKQMESEWNRDLLAENFGFQTKHVDALTIFPKESA